MNLQGILKSNDSDIRVTNDRESKWLVWYQEQWIVFYKGRGGSRGVKTLIQTNDIGEALQVLIKE